MSYEEVASKVRNAIEDYFKLELGRPEILNRIGENIVVFNYIRPEVAKRILDAQINKIIKTLSAEKSISLTVSEEAKDMLYQATLSNLNNGGRGIGNIVESSLINPLARFLFDNDIYTNANIKLESIDVSTSPVSVVCVVEHEEK